MKWRSATIGLTLWFTLQGAEVNLADGVSPSEAVALALESNPQLRAVRAGRTVAEGAVVAARTLPNPELRTGQVDFIDDAGGVRTQTYNVALRWSPPRLGERTLKGGAALGRVSEAGAGIAAAEQRLAAEVRTLHMNILFLDEQIRVADAAPELRQRIVGLLREQVGEGLRTALDENAAELALADARIQPDNYRTERRAAMARLAAVLGLPPSTELRLQPEGQPLLPGTPPAGTISLNQTAAGRLPELAALSARCAQADANLRLLRKEQYPWFSFLQLSRDFGGPDHSNAWSVRLGIDLPVFKWSGSTLGAATAEAEQCRLEIAAAEATLDANTRELAERMRESAAGLEYHRQTVMPLVERAVALANEAVAAGQADLLQSLNAEVRRLGQQQAYLAKLLDYRRLEIALDQALGRAVPR